LVVPARLRHHGVVDDFDSIGIARKKAKIVRLR
jgi:hypothetical protein